MTKGSAKQSAQPAQLAIAGIPLLHDVPPHVTFLPDELGHGAFVQTTAPKPAAYFSLPIGRLPMTRFTAHFRSDPWWMKPCTGDTVSAIPAETQCLLTALPNGQFALYVPLLDGPARCSLEGSPDGQLLVTAETGDPATLTTRVIGLYVAVGPDPYVLCSQGARSVAHRLATARLRQDKMLPPFIDDFGWCTWDAFYQEVSHEKVRIGLDSFRAGGIQPRLLILDDGWQTLSTKTGGIHGNENRLAAFAANAKFPGDLAPTVRMAKDEFSIRTFLVWHAFQGYWGGVDGTLLPGYGVRDLLRAYGPGILKHLPAADTCYWNPLTGIVAAEHIARFYHDYHRHLRRQGVDGVKVDNQATHESLSTGQGGRVQLMQRYHEALEGSVHVHFAGNLINCMSCSNDAIYNTLNSNLTRSSNDFFPTRPETHGLHLYANAHVGLWFGEFIHPDWDMFQSGHECGAYHAAGRALSGGPVYVSDKPDAHDFALLRKLVDSRGRVLRWPNPARPTRDNLFVDPTKDEALLKIFNIDGPRGIVGLFNARYRPEPATRKPIPGKVSPHDVEGLAGETFAVYLHRAQTVHVLARNKSLKLSLNDGQWELATIVPIHSGCAPLGLADKLNTPLGVLETTRLSPTICRVRLAEGQRFVAWSEKRPKRITANGTKTDFTWHAGTLTLPLPATATTDLEIRW